MVGVILHLQAATNNGDDSTERDTDAGESKVGDESSDFRRKRDEESTAIDTDNGDEVFDRLAEVGKEVTEAGGRGDNATEGNAEAGETETGDERGDFGGKLDEEDLCVGAGHDEDVVELGSKVLEELTGGEAVGRGNARGSGSGGGDGDARGDCRGLCRGESSGESGGESRGNGSSGAGWQLSKAAENGE